MWGGVFGEGWSPTIWACCFCELSPASLRYQRRKEAILAGASALVVEDNGMKEVITVYHEKSTELTAEDIGELEGCA